MLGLVLQLQGKLEEAETVGKRAVGMCRLSPNKQDEDLAYGEKPVFIGLSL